MADLENIGNMIAHYLLELYRTDEQMTKLLKIMFEESPMVCFAKLVDKSAIATLNTTQSVFACDGYLFYEYIDNGILRTMDINHRINFDWLFTMKIDGKTNYIYAGE